MDESSLRRAKGFEEIAEVIFQLLLVAFLKKKILREANVREKKRFITGVFLHR